MDLSQQSSIQTNLFVKITLVLSGQPQVRTFSDYHRSLVLAGDNYLGLGSFLSITSTDSNLRVTPQSLVIGISGIPQINISQFVTLDSRGAEVQVLRAVSDPVTGVLLDIADNPSGRFRGVINSFGITEDYDAAGRVSTHTITLNCASEVTRLFNLVAGRATNPWQQQDIYPGDRGFDRVPNIANANFNFGAP